MADASGDNWSEITSGDTATVRLAAPDLQQARLARGRIADGTIDGLAGLVADIIMADVADGVTFIPASPEQDMRTLADAALHRIARRLPLAGAA